MLVLHFGGFLSFSDAKGSEPGQGVDVHFVFSLETLSLSFGRRRFPFRNAMAGPTSSDVEPRPPSRPPRERDRPPRRKRPAGPEKHRHGLADDIESPWQNGIRVRFLTLMD